MSYNSKLPKFFEAMKKVLDDPNSLLLTDKELWVATNYKLARKDKVGLSTFEFWKSPTIGAKSPENLSTLDDELIEDFRETLLYARVKQKMNLTSNMMDKTNKNNWADVKLMEWKFKDLLPANNQQQIGSGKQPQLMININSYGNENETTGLINDIINGEVLNLDLPKKDSINPQIDNEI